MRGLRSSLSHPGSFCDESFIGGGGGLESSAISLSFFEIISRRREFSSIDFNRSEDRISSSRLYMLSDASIPFSIHSISCFFELRSSYARSSSSLRESISLGSDELVPEEPFI